MFNSLAMEPLHFLYTVISCFITVGHNRYTFPISKSKKVLDSLNIPFFLNGPCPNIFSVANMQIINKYNLTC